MDSAHCSSPFIISRCSTFFSSIKIITEYERAVIFRLGHFLPHAEGARARHYGL